MRSGIECYHSLEEISKISVFHKYYLFYIKTIIIDGQKKNKRWIATDGIYSLCMAVYPAFSDILLQKERKQINNS